MGWKPITMRTFTTYPNHAMILQDNATPNKHTGHKKQHRSYPGCLLGSLHWLMKKSLSNWEFPGPSNKGWKNAPSKLELRDAPRLEGAGTISQKTPTNLVEAAPSSALSPTSSVPWNHGGGCCHVGFFAPWRGGTLCGVKRMQWNWNTNTDNTVTPFLP